MADAVTLFPAGIVAAAGLVILLVGRVAKGSAAVGVLCGAALVLAGIVSFKEPNFREPAAEKTAAVRRTTIGRAIMSDRLSRAGTGLALALGLSMAATAGDGASRRAWRRLAPLLFSVAGLLLAAVANDLIVAIVALELASLPVTILSFLERDDLPAAGAAELPGASPLRGGHARGRHGADSTLCGDDQPVGIAGRPSPPSDGGPFANRLIADRR